MPAMTCRVTCLLVLSMGSWAADVPLVKLAPPVLRGRAVNPTLPEYPADSLKARKEGVVVVEITVSAEGVVTAVNVLESPDALMGESVVNCLKRWRFDPPRSVDNTQVFRSEGKLAFYFKLEGGKPVVVDAAAARRSGQRDK
jgi:protein TonB